MVALSVVRSVDGGVLYWYSLEPSEGLSVLFDFIFVVLVVLWVDADAKDHPEIYRPFEYGYLLLLFWLPYLPYYLWRTRGARGMVLFGAFLGLFWMPYVIESVVYVAR